MTAPGRWIRLNIGWEKSDWLAELSCGSRLSWVLLIGYVKAFGVCGAVRAMTTKGAAREFRVEESDFDTMLAAGIADGAIVTTDESWAITGWDIYQNEGNAERQRRYRADRSRLSPLRDEALRSVTKRNVTDSTGETLTLTETLTSKETPTTQKKRAVRRVIQYSPEFDELWKIRPKGPKPEAFNAYQAAIKKAPHEQMTYALGRYVREQLRPGFDGVHLHRWLEGERWEEYANGNGGNPHRPIFHDLGGPA